MRKIKPTTSTNPPNIKNTSPKFEAILVDEIPKVEYLEMLWLLGSLVDLVPKILLNTLFKFMKSKWAQLDNV